MLLPRFFDCLCAVVLCGAVASFAEASLVASQVFEWEALEVHTTNVGERRDLIDAPTSTMERFESHASTLNAGLDSHPQHQHAQEEFIILREGELEVIINGVAQRVGPGSLFFFAANDWHSVRNVGDGPATYLVFNYATAETRMAPASPAAESAGSEVLPSSVYEWKTLAVEATRTGERRAVFDGATVTAERLRCHITTLRAGIPSHAAHRHADEEIIVVKDGLIEATIEGESRVAGPGSVFFFASNELHGLRNAGETEATYYVFRIVTSATPEES